MNKQMKKTGWIVVMMVLVAVLTAGCAASMAYNGQSGPDMSVVNRQHTREDIERILGGPTKTISNSDGEVVEMYIVEARTKPSAIRAVGHGIMDLYTLGLWEFVGGPMEAYMGRRQRVTVRYNEEDRAMSILSAPIF